MGSRYEELRKKNVEDNKRILAELGLLNPFKPLPRVIKNTSFKRKRESSGTPKARKAFIVTTPGKESADLEDYGSASTGPRRRSLRIKGADAPSKQELKDQLRGEMEDEDDENTPRLRAPPNRPNVYGFIPGVDVGTWWATRIECNIAGIHRPTVAGIHGGPEGAYSIALSGGYEDDIDLGECFTYTGEGGRDLKGTKNNPKNLRTAPQSKDQTLSRGNLALSLNVSSGYPVRVIRGYKLRSVFAPEEGYRYDGLYKVEKFWFTTGLSGFGVYKFVMRRLPDQASPPWSLVQRDEANDGSLPNSQCDSGMVSDASSDCGSDLSSVQKSGMPDEKIDGHKTKEEEVVQEMKETEVENCAEKEETRGADEEEKSEKQEIKLKKEEKIETGETEEEEKREKQEIETKKEEKIETRETEEEKIETQEIEMEKEEKIETRETEEEKIETQEIEMEKEEKIEMEEEEKREKQGIEMENEEMKDIKDEKMETKETIEEKEDKENSEVEDTNNNKLKEDDTDIKDKALCMKEVTNNGVN